MQLRELLNGEGGLAGKAGDAVGGRHHRRQPRRCAGLRVLRAGRRQDRRRALRRAGAGRGRDRRRQRSSRSRATGSFVRVANARRTLALAAVASLPAPARHHRRRHRHQRQDLGRRLHAADLGACRASRGEPRHRRHRHAVARSLRLADDARSGRAASRVDELAEQDKITHLVVEASSHGLHQHRLDGVAHRGRRLHQSQPRPYGLPPDGRTLSRSQAAAVRRIAAARRRGGDRRRSRRIRARRRRARNRAACASSPSASAGRRHHAASTRASTASRSASSFATKGATSR